MHLQTAARMCQLVKNTLLALSAHQRTPAGPLDEDETNCACTNARTPRRDLVVEGLTAQSDRLVKSWTVL